MAWLNGLSIAVELVASFAAVVGLFLIYFQLRDSNSQTKALDQSIRSATYQGIVDSERELWLELARDKEFLDKHMGAYEVAQKYEIDAQELLQIGLICAHYENIFYQFQQNVIPDELWPEWEGAMVNNLNKPTVQRVWPDVKNWFWSDFSDFVDSRIAPTQSKDPEDDAKKTAAPHLSEEELSP